MGSAGRGRQRRAGVDTGLENHGDPHASSGASDADADVTELAPQDVVAMAGRAHEGSVDRSGSGPGSDVLTKRLPARDAAPERLGVVVQRLLAAHRTRVLTGDLRELGIEVKPHPVCSGPRTIDLAGKEPLRSLVIPARARGRCLGGGRGEDHGGAEQGDGEGPCEQPLYEHPSPSSSVAGLPCGGPLALRPRVAAGLPFRWSLGLSTAAAIPYIRRDTYRP